MFWFANPIIIIFKQKNLSSAECENYLFSLTCTYLSDGHIPIDNNLAERGINPFVINRKNNLSSNTEKDAKGIKHLYEYHSNSKNKRTRNK
ncbi:IS66 family transposase [Paracholeplasma brassicae]|uniref:IS66 family transposase n=1 Tax=Acholeplasma brassicae TaxID=61635 RepID=UPI0009FBCAEB